MSYDTTEEWDGWYCSNERDPSSDVPEAKDVQGVGLPNEKHLLSIRVFSILSCKTFRTLLYSLYQESSKSTATKD